MKKLKVIIAIILGIVGLFSFLTAGLLVFRQPKKLSSDCE